MPIEKGSTLVGTAFFYGYKNITGVNYDYYDN